MGISWGALAGAFLGPFFWGLFSGRISKAAVWASFIFAVGLTTSNMVFGFIGSPIVAGAIAIVASLIIVPIVSLVTPAVPFDIKPPQQLGAIDREYLHELEEEELAEEAAENAATQAQADMSATMS